MRAVHIVTITIAQTVGLCSRPGWTYVHGTWHCGIRPDHFLDYHGGRNAPSNNHCLRTGPTY
jgi:hypothetical protein